MVFCIACMREEVWSLQLEERAWYQEEPRKEEGRGKVRVNKKKEEGTEGEGKVGSGESSRVDGWSKLCEKVSWWSLVAEV